MKHLSDQISSRGLFTEPVDSNDERSGKQGQDLKDVLEGAPRNGISNDDDVVSVHFGILIGTDTDRLYAVKRGKILSLDRSEYYHLI